MDSESQTGLSIRMVMEEMGFPGVELEPAHTQGRTFMDIAAELQRRRGPFGSEVLAKLPLRLREVWSGLVHSAAPLPGAQEAVKNASFHFKVAVVSSSHTPYLDQHLERLRIGDYVQPGLRIGADKVSQFKPHPEGYLLAARLTQTDPSECLVFEDSTAGLKAARAAGMKCVAVTSASGEKDACRSLADAECVDFSNFSQDFWPRLGGLSDSRSLFADEFRNLPGGRTRPS